jgi:DNA topoisomerase-1
VKLIVTEKADAARKIADILGARVTVKEHGRGRQKVRSYHFVYEDDEAVAIGLRGHVMETVFPDRYRRWSLKHLGEMIDEPDLAWVVDAGAAGTLAALRTVAKGATEVVIATDYDREGELIGHEALEILRGDALKRHPDDKPGKPKKKAASASGRGKAAAEAAAAPADNGDPHVKPMLPAATVDRHVRVRYSALTREEVQSAFDKPSTVDFNLAEAAHSRQDIDLIWGAVLTRFMSLASYRYGSEYLAVGRVQSPTLRLVVERELERRAFVAVPYWEIKATLDHDGEPFEVAHAKGRFDAQEAMEAAFARAQVDTAEVTAYKAEPKDDKPPAPFNTTALMSAASGSGMTPARAMRAAESLYLDGLISYPRTDNTVYPPSLDLRGSLSELSRWRPVAATAARLHGQDKLTPARGKKRTTDHPPIYPVGVPAKELSGDQAKVYDLVVRRFLATLLPAAVIERQRVDIRIGEEPFLAYGARVASLGYLEVYEKYAAKRDRPLPALQTGDTLKVLDLRSEAKETQPPGRYGQGRLIEKMEDVGLGTKATRADIIQHLYDRNYVRDNPVEPTELGVALIAAFDAGMEKAPVDISSSEMTAELELRMDRISEGELRRDEVVAESTQMLEHAWKLLDAHVTDIRDRIKSGVREDLTLGECKVCGGQLRVLRGKTGKRFVACMGKEGEEPKPAAEGERPRRGCGQTFPLPQRGTITPTGKSCGACGWPEIKVVGAGGRGRPWVLCIDIDCPSKAEYRARAKARNKD